MARVDGGALGRALARWQAAAGPYWLYVGAAPFLGGRVERRRPAAATRPHETLVATAAGFAREYRAVVFVDLPPEETLPSTEAFHEQGLMVVPAFQRWCADGAIRRSPRLRQLLVSLAPASSVADPRGAVFLLDGERAQYRYQYPECRFPPPRLLRAEGVEAVGWIAPAGVAPDLRPYAATLAQAGLPPTILP
jgi:hypothetical protein